MISFSFLFYFIYISHFISNHLNFLTAPPIFNNSLKKGIIYLLEEDFPSNIYIYLIRYYIGSNYHSGYSTFIYEGSIIDWKALIPIKIDSKSEIQENKVNEPQIVIKISLKINLMYFSCHSQKLPGDMIKWQ